MAIDVEINDGNATVTMNRPEALNAFSPEQLEWLRGALRDVGPSGADTVRQFLRAMIDHDDPDKVLATILRAGNATAKE